MAASKYAWKAIGSLSAAFDRDQCFGVDRALGSISARGSMDVVDVEYQYCSIVVTVLILILYYIILIILCGDC